MKIFLWKVCTSNTINCIIDNDNFFISLFVHLIVFLGRELRPDKKSMRLKFGRKSFFTLEGKVALMFLKMYTGLSSQKQLNGNIHYQISCDVIR